MNLPSPQEGLDVLLDAIVRRMVSVTNAYVGVILLREDEKYLAPSASIGIEDEYLRGVRVAMDNPRLTPLLAHESIHYIENMAAVSPPEGFANKAGLRSSLFATLRSRGRVVGAAILSRREVSEFSEVETARVKSLADRAAVAIDNTQLYTTLQQRAQQLEVLLDLSSAMNAQTDQASLSSVVAEAALNLTGTQLAVVVVFSSSFDEGEISAVATREVPEEAAQQHAALLLPLASEQDEQVCHPDIALHPRAEELGLRDLPYESVLVTPVVREQRRRAAVILAQAPQMEIASGDEEFMRLLAGHASLAFQNIALIEEVRQRNELAQQRADLLETLINSIAEPVFIAAPPDQIIDLNRRATELLGLDRSQVIGGIARYHALVQPELPDGSKLSVEEMPVSRALRGQTYEGMEVLLRAVRSGDVPLVLSYSGAPIRDASGNVLLAVTVAHNITEEYKLRRARDELLSVASHELKTPLTLIRANAQLLARAIQSAEDPRLSQRYTSLLRQIDRMQQLVELLLDLSRLETGRLVLDIQPIDLRELVDELVTNVKDLQADNTVLIDMPPGPVMVCADRLRVEQVLGNLLGNAARYSPKGADLHLTVKRLDSMVEVAVTDEGIGIAPADLQRVFDRFYQVPGSPGAQSGSMGMGLYISKGIIEAHGGRIWAESVLGQGSTFRFTLPTQCG